jgi:hypothetical protein
MKNITNISAERLLNMLFIIILLYEGNLGKRGE